MADAIMSVRGLRVAYQGRRGSAQAVRGVDLDLFPGETLALIGESGCGKSTLGFSLIRLSPSNAKITDGNIIFRGRGQETAVLQLSTEALRRYRWQDCALVLQSALNAFNPVIRVRDHFIDTAKAHGLRNVKEIEQRAAQLLTWVQLDPKRVLPAYPHELSGGMRQRLLLALGLLLEPRVVILDEPTTALDVLTQRSIIEMLQRLKAKLGFTMILISHDLSLAAELADRVATMYAGQIIELADVYTIFDRPAHPYTLGLIHAVPTLGGRTAKLVSIPGSPPDLVELPKGCAFHPRCQYATDLCRNEEPTTITIEKGHTLQCHHWKQVADLAAQMAKPGQELASGGVTNV
ncbi:MAG: ABC transporter ATP-binding protein [Bacillota bacterium]